MANASAKRIASQNEKTVQNLHIGMIVAFLLSTVFRVVLRRSSKTGIFLHICTSASTFSLYRYLVTIGASKRDSAGTLISSGEDLSHPGVIEWCFDILYIAWTCQLGSSIFGERFWWLYLIIPGYAGYKSWTMFSPMLFGGSRAPAESDENTTENVSKRQQKLRQRSEKGDPRVRSVPVKK